MSPNHIWFIVFLYNLIISFYLLYLYRKDKDKRKLIFSIGLLSSTPSFLGLFFGQIGLSVEQTSILWYNIFTISSLPLLVAVFLAVNQVIFKIKNYDRIFQLFLIITAVLFIAIFVPYKFVIIPTLIRQILSIETILVIVYLYFKFRYIDYIYFFMFEVCSVIAGVGFSLDLGYLSGFSFLLSFVFITLFSINKKSGDTTDDMRGFFSLKQQLESTEKKYQTLFNTIPDGIYLLSEKGTILDMNETMAHNLKIEKDQIIGGDVQTILPEDINHERLSMIETALLTNENQENEVKRDDHYFHNHFVPLTSNHEKSILIIEKDITSQKQAEHQRESQLIDLRNTELATLNIMEDMQETLHHLEETRKEVEHKNKELLSTTERLESMNKELNIAQSQLTELNRTLEEKVKDRTKEIEKLVELKDSFIHQLGHDLKTPITPLNSLLPIIKNKSTDPDVIKSLDVCIDKVNYMKSLVTETLNLASLNSPHVEIHLDKVNLSEIVGSVIQDQSFNFMDQHFTINNHISDAFMVSIDRLRFTELLHNLMSNAVKYSPEGGTIDIQAEEEDEMIHVMISDSGIGLTEEQRTHIFDEFYKADESRHDFQSTGLGLSIAKQIIEKHGGKIWAESKGLGKGSTFHFTIKK